MAIPFIDDEAIYANIFAEQNGYGMPRYRGSPMVGGSFWGRLVTFAKGLFRTVSPHVSELLQQAHPHIKGVASRVVDTAIDSAVNKVSQKLKNVQDGSGRKKRKRIKAVKAKKKITRPKELKSLSFDNF